jgi:hypothetical protein
MATILKAGNVASGAQITSDATGILEIRTGTGAGTTAITVGTNQAVTFAAGTTVSSLTTSGAVSAGSLTVNSNNISAVNSLGFRNRIINGAMVIAQRGTAAVTSSSGAQFPVDRFFIIKDTATTAVMTAQQDSSAPAGFINSVKITTTTAQAVLAATDYHRFAQQIEGFNAADLGWGTANAQSVTLSFWVRSSLTGTFGGSLGNSAWNRTYPFTYTISAANTWEQKTVTIPGDTSGTWLSNNGIGLRVDFGLGVGTTYSGTASAWAGALYISATGATNVSGTLNATWYITGVQLEAGSVATPFERRDYGRELMMCQRYAWSLRGDAQFICNAFMRSTTTGIGVVQFPVTMRATAAMTVPNATDYFNMSHGNQDNKAPTLSISGGGTQINQNNASVGLTFASGSSTIGWGGLLATSNANSYVLFTAEL